MATEEIRSADHDPAQAERDTAYPAREATRKVAEQAVQATQTMAAAGERVSRATAEVAQHGSASVQDALRSGTEIANRIAERSIDQVSRALGLNGDSPPHMVQQSSRNFQAIVETGTVLADGMRNVSGEWIAFAQRRVEQNLDRVDALWACRTVPELVAVQTDIVRDNIEGFLQAARRASEISTRTAAESVRKMNDASLVPR
jgi:hypothetical protein